MFVREDRERSWIDHVNHKCHQHHMVSLIDFLRETCPLSYMKEGDDSRRMRRQSEQHPGGWWERERRSVAQRHFSSTRWDET